jgi:mannose-6-phosphate isomerase-like protein (cupin superfamily)
MVVAAIVTTVADRRSIKMNDSINPISIHNWKEALIDAKADLAVGIKIATIAETANGNFYVTEIPAGSSVNPHYHCHGDEFYFILSGQGVIKSAPASEGGGSFNFVAMPVKSGDTFIVSERMIHQLKNTGEEPLVLIFSCPVAHVTDDRVIVKSINQG